MDNMSTYITQALILVLIGVITKFLVPYVKSQITTQKLSFIKTWVDSLVNTAEQKIQGSKMGDEKKKWVVDMLKKLGIVVDDSVDALIESAVFVLNNAIDSASKIVTDGLKTAPANNTSNVLADAITDATSVTK